MKTYETSNVRNIALIGHAGSGKTTFIESMLFTTGYSNRMGSIGAKNTASDHTEVEQERQNSIFCTPINMEWKNHKINVIDTPGFDDFVGEVYSALKAADTAVMVMNATQGVEVGTELNWETLEEQKKPAMILVNQLDQDKSDFDKCIEMAKNRFGGHVTVLQYPVNQGTGFNAIIDVVKMKMYEFSSENGKPVEKPIPEDHKAKAEEMHAALIESAAENDEALMEKYFEEETLSDDEIAKGLKLGLLNHGFFPVLCASSVKNMGAATFMDFLVEATPSPAEMPATQLEGDGELAYDSNGPSSVFIFKTSVEPNVGMLSFFKVCSGILKTGVDLVNTSTSTTERLNQVMASVGKNRTGIDELKAGDIGVTVKLKDSHTGNTLNPKGTDHKICAINFPAPKTRSAVSPPSKADLEKLAMALHQIQEEDQTLIVEQSKELKQTLIHGQGELHLQIVKWKVEKYYKIGLDFIKPRIAYRETIQRQARTDYRHKKQTGGAGQFAEVHMMIEPFFDGMPDPPDLNVRNNEEHALPWGGKLVFMNCIVGGAIDNRFMSAILKGVMMKMEDGPLTGSYCRDIRVGIYDGKMHPVDSNDMAFQTAGSMAFRNAFKEASPQIMEPIYDVEVMVGDDSTGDVMSDFQTRRGVIQGIEAAGHYQKIKVKVPLSEMHGYSSTLRSMTQGRAKYSQQFAEFAPVPHEVQSKLINAHQAELEEA